MVENTAGLNGPINGLFTLLDTFAYVTPVSGMKGGSQNNEEVQTTYPVKSDQKATAKIASLINASPLNSYGDDGDKKAIYPEVRGRQLQNIFDDWKTNKSC
ncbi:hypothetical protein MPTA7396_3860 [Mycoplasmoides pneumoniae]|nr:hypothetical protein KPI25BX_7180 [Mycoplasmoides pneumoniae]GLL58517.1 hypothetical protein Y1241N_5650 [Mycoplasmoides pneumoniae]GLL59269.1 hypothetical protein Y12242BV_5950 [Mycoplasmoides pneumoniae]GLL60036.1 hypothetical protein Y12382J_6440 [Mycoplasmoides pneumoniae]GLL60837.1 hypothetical protein OA571N_7250 [Mycoplasmoides pneumoniae]